jgi:stearoyl-CoA desaturase (delta-9 desaturase)
VAVGIQHIREGVFEVWFAVLVVALYVPVLAGITVGFHRMLAHKAFEAHPAVRAVLAILGSMALQGPVIYWVSNHRRHHSFADRAGDPHSPHCDDDRHLSGWQGLWHAHVAWTFDHKLTNASVFCRDLFQDGVIRWVNETYYVWGAVGLLLPAALGFLIGGRPEDAWYGFIWGAGIRLFFSYQFTNAINSVTHLSGYRNYDTRDHSRNNLWLGLPTLGEGWHNNHHADPRSAIFRRQWWEVDIGGGIIRLLEHLGLAWNVIGPQAARPATPQGDASADLGNAPSRPPSSTRETA